MTEYTPLNLDQAFSSFDDRWSPKIAAQVNNMQLKIVKVEGEFVEHVHIDTDELFLVRRGRLRIELPDGDVELGPGDVFVIPAGVRHKPVAEEICEVILLEPVGTENRGEQGGTTGEQLR